MVSGVAGRYATALFELAVEANAVDAVLADLRQFDTLQGQPVIVHYKQKNAPLFWRGDSPYLVDSVKLKR